MDTRLIMKRLYAASEAELRNPRQGWGSRQRLRLLRWLERHNWQLILGLTMMACSAVSHAYYYNVLVMYEFGVKVTMAQVEATQQKRNHVQRNLTRLIRYYAEYEESLMSSLTRLRAREKAGASTPRERREELQTLLGRLDAVAEQYPNPQLVGAVQTTSQAVIASETEVTQRIMDYNNAVNAYTTLLHTFPTRLFAKTMGFESYDFYAPDPDETPYREVNPWSG